METLQLIVLAVVQGIAEFLPISSDGHLVIVAALFEANSAPPPVSILETVIIILHLGTLLAIFVFYWPDIRRLLGADRRAVGLLIAGTIPVVLVGLPTRFWLEQAITSPLLAGCMLPLNGLLLIWAGRRKPSEGAYLNLSLRQALLIGLFQAAALLPGISRSGTTIAAGLAVGLRRDAAATFSFLLAVLAISGACVLELGTLSAVGLNGTTPESLAIGVLVSFVVGLAALWWLTVWLRKGRLHLFAYWCFAVGAAVVIWQVGLAETPLAGLTKLP